jgi:hypothetical protein
MRPELTPLPAAVSRLGVLDVPQVRAVRPARSGRCPQYRPWRAPWPRILGVTTMAMSFISEERQRRSRGYAAATLRADGGRGRFCRCSSSTMLGHRLPPRALNSAHEPRLRAALRAPAGPLGRKPLWARHLAALATKPGEICGLEQPHLRASRTLCSFGCQRIRGRDIAKRAAGCLFSTTAP